MSNVMEKILNLYPNVEIKNEMFFNEKVLNDFSLEDIAFKLCSLDKNDAWYLYMYLYTYGSSSALLEMQKFIVCNNIEYFRNSNNEKFNDINILREYTRLFSNKDFSLEDLEKIRYLNTENIHITDFYHVDISYFNEIIIIQKLYKDNKIKLSDIKDFLYSKCLTRLK